MRKGRFAMGNEGTNKQFFPLSEEEIEHVMKFRDRQARLVSPGRRVARILSLLATSTVLVLIAITYVQAVDLNNNGYSGEIPVPLSWVLAALMNLKS